MTKQQEIARMTALINSLGEDSYLRPWLESVKWEVESMIRNDIFPDLSLAHTAKQVARERAECKAYCDTLRANTEKQCAREVIDTKEEIARYRRQASQYMQSIADKL